MRLATLNKDLHILENKNNLLLLIEVEWCPFWKRYSFLGEIYRFKGAIINFVSTLYTIKSTIIFLASVRQCNAKIQNCSFQSHFGQISLWRSRSNSKVSYNSTKGVSDNSYIGTMGVEIFSDNFIIISKSYIIQSMSQSVSDKSRQWLDLDSIKIQLKHICETRRKLKCSS